MNQLAELNSYVNVQSYVGELTEEVLNKFRVSVIVIVLFTVIYCCLLLFIVVVRLLCCVKRHSANS